MTRLAANFNKWFNTSVKMAKPVNIAPVGFAVATVDRMPDM